jgi:steroid delta-isomerase-like uncharacterized protein
MGTDSQEQCVKRAFEAFNDHDADGVAAEIAEEGIFTDPFQEEPLDKAEFHASCVEVFEAFPDARWERHRLVGDDGTVMIEATFHATFEGPLGGIPPTGEAVELPAVSVLTVGDDGITNWRDYWDEQTFRDQLGLSFPAIIPHLPGILWWQIRSP